MSKSVGKERDFLGLAGLLLGISPWLCPLEIPRSKPASPGNTRPSLLFYLFDGVALLITDPPPHSSTTLSDFLINFYPFPNKLINYFYFKFFYKWHLLDIFYEPFKSSPGLCTEKVQTMAVGLSGFISMEASAASASSFLCLEDWYKRLKSYHTDGAHS